MMTSSNGNIFRVTGPLYGEFTSHRWIPLTKASDAELWCFLWSAPWISGWVNNREAGNLRHHRAHYDVIVLFVNLLIPNRISNMAVILTFRNRLRRIIRQIVCLCKRLSIYLEDHCIQCKLWSLNKKGYAFFPQKIGGDIILWPDGK